VEKLRKRVEKRQKREREIEERLRQAEERQSMLSGRNNDSMSSGSITHDEEGIPANGYTPGDPTSPISLASTSFPELKASSSTVILMPPSSPVMTPVNEHLKEGAKEGDDDEIEDDEDEQKAKAAASLTGAGVVLSHKSNNKVRASSSRPRRSGTRDAGGSDTEISSTDNLSLYSVSYTSDAPKTDLEMAKAIVNKFVLDQAGHSINIEQSSQQAMMRMVDERTDDFEPFFTAQKEIFNLMFMDTFPRFKQRALNVNTDAATRSQYRLISFVLTVCWLAIFLPLLFSSVTQWARIAVAPFILFSLTRGVTGVTGL